MRRWLSIGWMLATCSVGNWTAAKAQENVSAALVQVGSGDVVPAVVSYSGALPGYGQERVSVRFSIYTDPGSHAALWTENQNITPDKEGKFTVLLGSASSIGLPSSVFADGQARWLGIQAGNGEEQRSLLTSVPFAMKSGDASTLAGRSVTDFVTADQLRAQVAAEVAARALTSAAVQAQPMVVVSTPTGSGTAGYLPIWTAASSLGNSALYQTGSGGNARTGFGTATPASTVDVNGQATVRGGLILQSPSATASGGYNSPYLDLVGSSYNSSAAAATPQRFRWQVLSSGNDTSTPTASLALGFGSTSASATGLSISSKGIITFASGQTFPGAASGSSTVVNAASYDLGGSLFAYGSAAKDSAFLGFSGNAAAGTTYYNTAAGSAALQSLSTGTGNSSYGYASLYANTAGAYNTASGLDAMSSNTTGSENTSVGAAALAYNQTGSFNTAVGTSAGPDSLSPTLTNATAIGANATVSQSNSLILGSTTTSPGASHVNVGIGTATPVSAMEIAVRAQDAMGPTLTLTNSGGTSSASGYHPAMASLDFKTYLHVSTQNSPTSRIEAVDENYGNELIFQTKQPGSDSNPLVNVMELTGGRNGTAFIENPLTVVFYNGVPVNGSPAGSFGGDVSVDGTISADAKFFKIDHPSDPANKYLQHASIESSEMMNIYSGNVTTDELGQATVQLPDWFEAENGDFRYQLTTIGRDAHAWVAEEVSNHQFKIATNATFVKVSWQVTGVRQDAYAKAHPLVVEPVKPAIERGSYIHPELYGQPEEKRTMWAKHPDQWKQMQARQPASISVASKDQPK